MHKLIIVKNNETKQLEELSDTKYSVIRLEIQRCNNDMYAYILLEFDDF